jgi:hypothetical protein
MFLLSHRQSKIYFSLLFSKIFIFHQTSKSLLPFLISILHSDQNVILSAIFASNRLKTDNLYAVSALAQRLTCRVRVINEYQIN